MAERRRRRKSNGSEDSEDISYSTDEEKPPEKPNDLDNSTEIDSKVAALSEYGSAEEDEDGLAEVHHVHQLEDGLDKDLDNPVDEEGGQEERADLLEGDYIDDEGEWRDAEREEGDGEESEKQGKEKVLDDDEDKRNPQYIPKKGGFYEHDDRLTEEAAEEEEKKKGKKKLWKDEGKWMHDRYREDEQNPKSRDELTVLYGYDIRNEDGPPRARRRRRYGRGPSKYTRKWEDEDAYGKTALTPKRGRDGCSEGNEVSRGQGGRGSQRRGYNRGGRISRESRTLSEEFPKLGSNLEDDNKEPHPSIEAENTTSVNRFERDETGEESNRSNDDTSGKSNTAYPKVQPFPRSNRSRGRARRGIRGSRYNYNGPLIGQRQTTERKWEGPVDISNVANELDKMTIKDGNANFSTPAKEIRKEAKVSPTPHTTGSMSHERRQAAVPPRMQDSAASRPKRYSSQRQRQMPESVPYQQTPAPSQNAPIPPRFYDTAYQPSVYPDHNSPNNVAQGPAPLIPPQPYQGYEGPYPEAYAMRPMATSPRMFSPVALPAGQPVMPAPYIASGGNVMSYGPPPATYTQYPYQQYPAPPPPPQPVGDPLDNPLSALQPPPQEIFRGGMAYYNAQPPVRTLPKRPRAAIPIVPPPEMEEPRKEDNDETSVSIDTLPYESQPLSNEDGANGNEAEN